MLAICYTRVRRVLVLIAVVSLLGVPSAAAEPVDEHSPVVRASAVEWASFAADEVIAPAAGEVAPPSDPTEPTGQIEAATVPEALIAASSRRWPSGRLTRVHGSDQVAIASAVARRGWPRRARYAVLATADRRVEALAAAGLAGAVRAPLLLTPRLRMAGSVVRDLRRLRPRRVFVVGSPGRAVARAVRRLRLPLTRVGAGQRAPGVAWAAARTARRLGADTRTLVVVNGRSLHSAASAAALAAHGRHPIVFAGRGTRRAVLRNRLAELRTRKVIVLAGRGQISGWLFRRAARVRRVHRFQAERAATAIADLGRRRGLAGSPVVVRAGDQTAAVAAGVWAGARKSAPLLVVSGRMVSDHLASWLALRRARVSAVVGRADAVPRLTVCQLGAGQDRSWRCAEGELARQGYNTGRVDGRTDRQTVWAVYAFQKVAGLRVDGRFGQREWRALARNRRLPARRPDLGANHVEIDLRRQLILLIRDGHMAHAFHTSTGKPSTPTIRGAFTVYEKRGYRQPWNGIYKGIFWHGGYAIHGYPSVPLYPASHGCNRTYDGDQDFLWPKVFIGERVAVY